MNKSCFSIISRARVLLCLASLLAAAPAISADFDYAAYRNVEPAHVAGKLKKELQQISLTPNSLNLYFDAAQPRYHTVATFTGNTRPILPDTRVFIRGWVKSFGHPAYEEMDKIEVEFKQGDGSYWMPMQQVLVASFGKEVPPGSRTHLYVLLMGSIEREPVFSVSEFDAVQEGK